MNHQGTKTPRDPIPGQTDHVAHEVVDAAFRVHDALGPGLLESAYERCMLLELESRNLSFENQVTVPIVYRDTLVDAGYRLDLVVEHRIIVELKAVDMLLPIHEAQLLTYLKLTGHRVGLLINFNVPIIKKGIRRMAL